MPLVYLSVNKPFGPGRCHGSRPDRNAGRPEPLCPSAATRKEEVVGTVGDHRAVGRCMGVKTERLPGGPGGDFGGFRSFLRHHPNPMKLTSGRFFFGR